MYREISLFPILSIHKTYNYAWNNKAHSLICSNECLKYSRICKFCLFPTVIGLTFLMFLLTNKICECSCKKSCICYERLELFCYEMMYFHMTCSFSNCKKINIMDKKVNLLFFKFDKEHKWFNPGFPRRRPLGSSNDHRNISIIIDKH